MRFQTSSQWADGRSPRSISWDFRKTSSPHKRSPKFLRGGLEKAAEVGCAIIGGHSIRNPEPIYGLAVTGVVDLGKILTNANARAGDLLVLTKPLGTGIATTAIKRGLASRSLEKKVIALMSQTNSVGAELAERKLVRAATDVTGFGLLGHLANMCRASKVSAEIFPDRIPPISAEIFKLIERDCVPGGSRDNLKERSKTSDLTLCLSCLSAFCSPMPKPAVVCCFLCVNRNCRMFSVFSTKPARRVLPSSVGSRAEKQD